MASTRTAGVIAQMSVTATATKVLLGTWDLFTGGTPELRQEFEKLQRLNQPSLVVTANVDHVNTLARDKQLARAYDTANLRLIDGAPLAWLARVISRRSVKRHTGADLLPLCAKWSSASAEQILILGGDRAVGTAAVELLRQSFRGQEFSTWMSPI